MGIHQLSGKKEGKFMQKTRFEGQGRPARAATRPSRILFGFIFGAAIATAGCVDTSKATGGRDMTEAEVFVFSPDGEVPPKGLEMVELGMSMAEVEAILGRSYEVTRIKSDVEKNVFTDQFTYRDRQEFKIATVRYRDGKVYIVRFGYDPLYE